MWHHFLTVSLLLVATLSVLVHTREPPSCLNNVKSIISVNGSSILLPCQVQGSPTPTIKWSKDGGAELDSRFSITPKGLYLKNVRPEDAGKYQVTLSNDAATNVESVELEIVSVKPENYEAAKEGQRAWLPCEKMVVSDKDTVVWKKDGIDVVQKSKGEDGAAEGGGRAWIHANGTLVFDPVLRNDLGLYVCSVTTLLGGHKATIAKTMFLNVQYVPSIMHILPTMEVFVGGNTVLPCAAEGNPGVNFQWLFPNGKPIRNTKKFIVSTNGSLVVTNVGFTDARNYTCAPYSDLGNGEQRHTELVVLSPPEFLNDPKKEVYVLEGKQITLDCASGGIPKPVVTWGFKNKNLENKGRYLIQSIGMLTISDARGSDAGPYFCIVSSKAGKQSRTINLVVKGKPSIPEMEEASVNEGGIVFVRWKRGYAGGSNQSFEVWARMDHQDDYQWKKTDKIPSKPENPSEGTRFQLSSMFKNTIPQDVKVTYFFSVRATNERGASGFSYVVKVVILPSERSKSVPGSLNQFIVDKPFPPCNVTVNSTRAGYIITWKEMVVPGRPPVSRIVAQYRLRGSQHQWHEYVAPKGAISNQEKRRRRRSATSSGPAKGMIVKPTDLEGDNIGNLEFQVVAESAEGVRSDANKPTFIITEPLAVITPVPSTAPKANDGDNEGGLGEMGPVLLGGILGGFAILLAVTIYCLCRKRKKQKYSASKNQNIAFTKENGVNMEHAIEAGYSSEDGDHGDHGDNDDETDQVKLLSPSMSDEHDSPRRYHLQSCPALKLGEYTDGDTKNGGRVGNKDPVYFLLQRYEEEKEMCTCSNMRYMTLNTHEQKAKRDKKRQQKRNNKGGSVNGSIYKSNSSPSLLLTSENEEESSGIDPAEMLDEEGFDLSDNERDAVGELHQMGVEKYPTLKRQKFKDSYDQFCRDGSSSKDPRQRLSSEEKTEADKNFRQGDLVNMKDVNDVSSENSATESERVITPPSDKMMIIGGGDLSDRGGNNKNRRSKSSGFGDGSNSTSDSESIHPPEMLKSHHSSLLKSGGRLPPYTNGYLTDTGLHHPQQQRRDHGYNSDFSTRSSPLDYNKKGGRYPPPSSSQRSMRPYEPQMSNNYYSEDESVRSGNSLRPVQPPPYTQALHDIERLSEKNDITDSEDMYDHLLDMGRQLGVTLDDSIESDLNMKGMAPPPPRSYSNPRAYPPPSSGVGGGLESGYLTDNSVSAKDRYTEREKSERCAQLLNEFKSSKSRNTINNNTDTEHDYEDELPVEPPVLRSRSVMGNKTATTDYEDEEPRVPPVLRRSNSAGSSGVFKEWLV